MSEKRVNIKITASTSDFDKAIKKAQKQIKELTDTIADINKDKFGDELEKQFKNIIESAEKAQEQLKNIKDSLDDIDKIKLDKLDKQLKDMADSTEKLNDKLKGTKDALEDLTDETKDLGTHIDNTTDSMEKLDNAANDFGNNANTEKFGDDIKDIKQNADNLTESFDNINGSLSNVDASGLKKISNMTDDIKDKFSGDNTLKFDTNGGNSILDSTFEGAVAGTMVANKMSDAMGEVVQKINQVTESMKDMNQFTFDEQIKNYDKFIKEMMEAEKKYADLLEERNELQKDISDKEKNISDKEKEYEDKVNKTYDEVEALEKKLQAINNVNEATEEYKKELDYWSEASRVVTKELENQEKVIQDLQKEYDDTINAINDFTDRYKDLYRELEDGKELEFFDINNLKQTEDMIKELEDIIQDLFDTLDINEAEKLNTKIGKAYEEYQKFWNKMTSGESGLSFDDELKELDRILDDVYEKLDNTQFYNSNIKDIAIRITDLKKEAIGVYKEAIDDSERLNNLYEEQKGLVDDLAKAQDKLDQKDEEQNKLDEIKEKNEIIEKNIEKLKEDAKVLEDYKKANDLAGKSEEELQKELNDTYESLRKKNEELKRTEESQHKHRQEVIKQRKEVKQLQTDLDALNKAMAEGNQVTNDKVKEFDKEYKAYEKLSKKVKEYLEDESKSIVLREKVARSFKEVSDAMEKVYSGSSKFNNTDLVNKTLEDAKKYIEELNVVNTNNLQADLKRLGEIIDDKTEKIKRFKELNKTFGTDDGKAAHWLEQEAEAIKDMTNKMGFAIEAADTLRKAWGDVSVGGEDHLKIRARAEALSDYGETLKKNIRDIRNYYYELETLDEIYEQATADQKQTIDDYRAWEKSREELVKYNKAIQEYVTTLLDAGGQIDDKFLTDGKFDVDKFIKDFEKMGTTSVVLQKQFNAIKIELQEWLQTEKEVRQEAVKNAESALEQAKADKKAAESKEDLREATEKVAKAQEELNRARESLKNFTTDASKEVKQLNEMAEALRKIGMAAEDLGKEDIAKFDKSLASLLDRLKTFDNDLPKTFGDLKEDIAAVFADMDGLDFGGVLDGLKDIGAGLLGKLPTELKVAAAAAVALGVALKECAEIGINQFTRGMETISNALSGIINIARDIGQEIRDAFENITGMQLDMSSLIELPIEFEAQMARVGAIAGATDEEFKKLEETARKLGATTPFSASEVAEAMEYMGQAGWGYDEIKNGIEGVLQLATIAEMELGQASEFITDAINTFPDMDVKDAAHLVDVLAEVSVKTSTSVAQMQKAFSNCAPVAGTLGISVEDLSMALGLMANQGVKGAKAGTAMKNLMTNLSTPTEKQLSYIKKFNLESAQQAIVNGDLLGGLKQMKQALSTLTPQQQNAVIATIAGREALSGVSALLNSTAEDITDLEKAMADCGGSAAEMAGEFEKTLKGALNNLAGALEETTLQVFDKIEGSVASVINELTKFINILNGIEQSSSGLTGLAGALEYLEEVSQGWGDAIATGIEQGIGAISNFVNGEAFDNLLQAGTNIIDGIAEGVQAAADNGTLDSAISTAIRKIATWFSENLDTIIEVGKEVIEAISQGISENSDVISEVIRQVMEMQTDIDNAIAYEKWKLIGENLIDFICEGIVSKVSVFVSAVKGFFEGAASDLAGLLDTFFTDTLSPMLFDPIMKFGEAIGNLLKEIILGSIERAFDIDLSYLKQFNILDPTTWFGGDDKESKTTKKDSTSKTSTTSKSPTDKISNELSSGKVKTDKAAAEIGQGISDNILKKLETMDAGALSELRTEMENLQKTIEDVANGIGKSFGLIREYARTEIVGMTNIFRNQFINITNIARNQMINVTNIIRNQAINWTNIIRNQAKNSRDAFTQQMISMASVARTQLVNISNIIRNQSLSWYNVINNQAKNARDAFTRQMMSMVKVARNQMYNVLTTVRSYMSQITGTTNKGISLNVGQSSSASLSTTPALAMADALYAANSASTSSIGNNMGALAHSSSYGMSTGGGSSFGGNMSGNVTLEIPLMLDGKELARASAKYVNGELKLIAKRENRKRGVK